MGKTENSIVPGALGLEWGVSSRVESWASPESGNSSGWGPRTTFPMASVGHGPESPKLKASRCVTCLQKETSDIDTAIESFISVARLEFGSDCGGDDGGP